MEKENLAIEWYRAEDFSSKTGVKADKPLIRFAVQGRVVLYLMTIQLIEWSEGERITFGQDVKSKRIFLTKSGKGFKLRGDGKTNSNLTFTSKALCAKMLDYHNEKKKAVLTSGYEPSEKAAFLVVALEDQKGVYELLPILK